MTHKLTKSQSTIAKGKTEGTPIYTRGEPVRYLGFPVNQTGKIDLTGGALTFEGSMDGTGWFTISDYSGFPLGITAKAAQNVIPKNGLAPSAAILPVRDMFAGIQMVRPISPVAEAADRLIDFYFEPSL